MPPRAPMTPQDAGLSSFSRPTRDWFGSRFEAPTEIQSRAWPRIAAGEHVLVTAPTGSGKTLTAFLWALDRLLSGAWEGGGVRVLYISPLKALNNDIEKNLLEPRVELERAFEAAGKTPQAVRVGVRSGDTTAAERRKMLRHPPEVLITTPESLNILLTSPRGRRLFDRLETVILDEIHAVAASKRGTHLMTAVDRLVEFSGEFQRIALSATVRPLAEMSRFVGGYRLEWAGGEALYEARRVTAIESRMRKRYELQVCRPDGLDSLPEAGLEAVPSEVAANLWEALTASFRSAIETNRSTLLFTNSRRKAEKVARLLNEAAKAPGTGELAYSHHGSLSRELRSVVEERLKAGRLRAIVATNSLELGIDIGSLDEVLLVQTPPSIASTIQRVGRAGHAVGETAKARLFPFAGRDLLQAAVTARCVLEHDIEEIQPVRRPLDVLAQVILSMTVETTRGVDELFDRLRSSYSFHDLSRRQYDLVIEMLAGRYADSRVRELEPRLAFDRVAGTLTARRGVDRTLYVAGGTIPDRGYFQLRHHQSLAKLGELDEEFVWERSLGDTFTLGAQSWKIRKITHSDVLVSPAARGSAFAPFWRAEERGRSFHLSERLGEFLEHADRTLAAAGGSGELAEELATDFAMTPEAASELVSFLERQRSATGFLPHRRRLLAERLPEDDDALGRRTWIVHTGWGGRVNRPLALVLPVALRELAGESLEADANNDSLLITAPRNLDLPGLLAFLATQPLESLLKKSLEDTGLFGARFRESAGRALLLPRSTLKRRVPLWLQRERGKKLLASVSRYGDFPMVVETWRTCLEDMFDLDALKRLLAEFDRGEIQVDEVRVTSASPFSADLMWKTTNRLMYEDDSSSRSRRGALSDSVLREVVFSAELRPRFEESLLDEFERKLKRTHPGYAPRDALELVEWVKERWLVSEAEWLELVEAVERDAEAEKREEQKEAVESAAQKLARVQWDRPVVCAIERLPELAAVLGPPRSTSSLATGAAIASGDFGSVASTGSPSLEFDQVFGEWLRYFGPVPAERVRESFGVSPAQTETAIETLASQQQLVVDRFRRASEEIELCDAENLERLLRIQRSRRRPTLEARPLTELPLWLAWRQGLLNRGSEHRDLANTLEPLLGYPAPAGLWESDILPARLEPYYTAWLDSLLQETDLLWAGCGRERVTFLFPEEIGLLASSGEAGSAETAPLLPGPSGRFRFEEVARHLGLNLSETSDRLWTAAWAGQVSNTGFAAVRQGLASRFSWSKASSAFDSARRVAARAAARPSRRRASERWQRQTFYSGDWFGLDRAPTLDSDDADALDHAQSNKDRARLVLDRYGVVFRELLVRETGSFAWSRLFRTFRLMELSGEIVAGQFFRGPHGLQFATHDAVRRLADGLPTDAIYWMNAADPASPAGLGLESLRGETPARRPSNHLVFHGARCVVLSRRNGSKLEIRVPADHPNLVHYLQFLKNLLTRQAAPMKSVDVAEINGTAAGESEYASTLRRLFETTREGPILRLRRRYRPAAAGSAG